MHEGGRALITSPSIQAGESPAPRPLPESGLIAVVVDCMCVCVCVCVCSMHLLAGWRAGLADEGFIAATGRECGLRMIKRGCRREAVASLVSSRPVSSCLVLSPVRPSPITGGEKLARQNKFTSKATLSRKACEMADVPGLGRGRVQHKQRLRSVLSCTLLRTACAVLSVLLCCWKLWYARRSACRACRDSLA